MLDKNQKIGELAEKSRCRLGTLAGELVRVRSEDKEVILAEMEIEREMLACCETCLDEKCEDR